MNPWSAKRAVAGGLAGTGAVAVAMTLARRAALTRIEFPRVLATALGRDRLAIRAAGWALFVANGALLPFGYRAALRLAGIRGGVVAGGVLGLAHGILAAAGAALLSPLHPRPRRAALPTRGRPPRRALAVLAGVHVLYGAVVGASAPDAA
jgi:hypothetical protein